MLHVVVLLAVLVAYYLLGEDLVPPAPLWIVGLMMGMYLFVAAAASRLNTTLSLRRLVRAGGLAAATVRRHNLMRQLTYVWLIVGLAAVLRTGYGYLIVHKLELGSVPLVDKALALAPFILGIIIHWTQDYPFHRALHVHIVRARRDHTDGPPRTGWTRAQHLTYNIRHHLLFIMVPVGLIILIQDSLLLYGPIVLGAHRATEAILACASIIAAGGVFFFAPLMIVRIWHTERLDDGPIRSELEGMCRRLGLRFRELLVWRSGRMIANAGVMGLASPVRYILLSDLLLERMSVEQIKAVFAHEAGHVISRHILHMVVFAAAAGLLAVSISGAAADILHLGAQAPHIGAVLLLGLIWTFGFGWLSRRLERQCDVIAAWASDPGADDSGVVSSRGAAIFAAALQQVSYLNGIPPAQRSWRHGSIISRIDHVLHLAATGEGRRQADKSVGRIKLLIWMALLMGVLLAAAWSWFGR